MPVKKSNEAVKIVSDDYYAYRLPVTGTDELNELSANFNVMCEAIENNIRNYKFAIDNFIHEVKTPLTSIIGYADMLKSYDCTGECREEAVDYKMCIRDSGWSGPSIISAASPLPTCIPATAFP